MLCTFFLPPSWMDDGSEIIRFASPLPLPPHLAFMSGLNHFGWDPADPSKSLTYQLLRCHSGSAGLSSRIVKRTFLKWSNSKRVFVDREDDIIPVIKVSKAPLFSDLRSHSPSGLPPSFFRGFTFMTSKNF